jgi:hypothetical protein
MAGTDWGQITNTTGTLLSAYGQWAQGRAAKAEGESAEAAARIEANQMRQRAKAAMRAGQQNALDEIEQGELAASRALALAAAGGGGASDPTIVNIISGIADEGARRAGIHMRNAREESSSIRLNALSHEFGGQNAADMGRVQQAGARLGASVTAMKGATTLYERYRPKEL